MRPQLLSICGWVGSYSLCLLAKLKGENQRSVLGCLNQGRVRVNTSAVLPRPLLLRLPLALLSLALLLGLLFSLVCSYMLVVVCSFVLAYILSLLVLICSGLLLLVGFCTCGRVFLPVCSCFLATCLFICCSLLLHQLAALNLSLFTC